MAYRDDAVSSVPTLLKRIVAQVFSVNIAQSKIFLLKNERIFFLISQANDDPYQCGHLSNLFTAFILFFSKSIK